MSKNVLFGSVVTAIPATVAALNDNLYGAVVLVLLGGMALAAFAFWTRR